MGTTFALESIHGIPRDPAASTMRGTVLIVDDDAEVIRTFADWLRLQGYETRTASSGEAALPQVHGVDAIILDARMPILDGLGFLRRIRAHDNHVRVAIVTGDY